MTLLEDKDIEAWLSECRTQSTRNIYTYGANLFFAWLKKEKGLGLEQFKALSIKEMKTLLLQYQNSSPMSQGHTFTRKHKHRGTGTNVTVLPPKPLSRNAIGNVLTAMQSFAMYLEKPLFLKGKRVDREDDTHSHYFVNGDLTKMYDVSDLRGKAILATAASLGWGMIDFLALKRSFIEALLKKAEVEGKEYVYFETNRIKTHARCLGMLNPLAIKSLREWLVANPLEDKDIEAYLSECHTKSTKRARFFRWLEKEKGLELTQIKALDIKELKTLLLQYQNSQATLFGMHDWALVKFMHAIARKANLAITGPVRFHRIRAWTFNTLLKAGFNELAAKYIVGKAISHSDSTYLRLREDIEQKYPKVYGEYLDISGRKVVAGLSDEDRELLSLLRDPQVKNALLRLLEQP